MNLIVLEAIGGVFRIEVPVGKKIRVIGAAIELATNSAGGELVLSYTQGGPAFALATSGAMVGSESEVGFGLGLDTSTRPPIDIIDPVTGAASYVSSTAAHGPLPNIWLPWSMRLEIGAVIATLGGAKCCYEVEDA